MSTKVMNCTLKIHAFNSLLVKTLRTLFWGTHLPLPQVLNMNSLIGFPDDALLGFVKLSMLMPTSFFFCIHFLTLHLFLRSEQWPIIFHLIYFN